MPRPAAALAAIALLGALLAAGGCGLGPGESGEGEADLVVTRDYGAERLLEAATTDPAESDSVVRFLDREADIETSFGGNFVDSIDGLEGSVTGGGEEDWFFFVNGFYSEIGAGEARVHPGDRIWWDYRVWAAAYQVPAVVGSFPQPFLDGYQGEPIDTVVECLGAEADCEATMTALEEEGVDARLETPAEPERHPDELRVLVGPWERLRDDRAAAQLERGPEVSGVFATLEPCPSGSEGADEWRIDALDADARPSASLGEAGLVAAVRDGADQPTWLVTGTDEEAVADAVELIDPETLADKYALATSDAGELALPVTGESGSETTGVECP